MKIRPRLNYRHANTLGPSLDKTKIYSNCEFATNQPDWQEHGKIFVYFDDDKENSSILLNREEYEVVEYY